MAMGGAGPSAGPAGGPAPAPSQPSAGSFFGANGGNAPPMAQVPQSVASMEPPRQTARREMKGPSGVDDILKTFEEVRRNEIVEGNMGQEQMSQPALNAAMEIQSMASDDIGSMTESVRQRGGRRRRAAPLGSTMELNV